MVIPLSSAVTLHCFSSLAPAGQGDKGSSPALLIFTMEQPFSSINALVLTLCRLAESCIFKWFGYKVSSNWKSSIEDGNYRRKTSQFRQRISADGKSGFKAELGRYHLYVSLACPWAHRTLVFRELKGLTEHVSVSVVHPDMHEKGWSFQHDENSSKRF